jgi:hypothetical protein
MKPLSHIGEMLAYLGAALSQGPQSTCTTPSRGVRHERRSRLVLRSGDALLRGAVSATALPLEARWKA